MVSITVFCSPPKILNFQPETKPLRKTSQFSMVLDRQRKLYSFFDPWSLTGWILARPSVLQRDLRSWFRLCKLERTNPVLIIGSINSGCTDHAQIISSGLGIFTERVSSVSRRIAAIMRMRPHRVCQRRRSSSPFKYFRTFNDVVIHLSCLLISSLKPVAEQLPVQVFAT